MTQFGAKICQTKEAATFVACDVSQNRATVLVNFQKAKSLSFQIWSMDVQYIYDWMLKWPMGR